MKKCVRCDTELRAGKSLCHVCKAFNAVTDEHSSVTCDEDDTSTSLAETESAEHKRLNVGEWNPIFGKEEGKKGGIVTTSVNILAGTPGAGKSTGVISLIRSALKAHPNRVVMYLSGEELKSEVRSRADRLGCTKDELERFRIIELIKDPGNIPGIFNKWKPVIGIVDSIQGICGKDDAVAEQLCTDAKRSIAAPLECPMILISHVNKGAEVAGAMTLQHAVDGTFLLMPIDDQLRQLEALKNRNGPTRSIYFTMTEAGLVRARAPEEDE
jgi:predicted ATP-dependent serine protease